MKCVLFIIVASLFLGCSPSDTGKPLKITDLVMPASEYAELSGLEVILAVNDIDKPNSSTPDFVIQILKELGVVGAVNFTYTWGDTNKFLLIDSNIHRFPSSEEAKKNLLGAFLEQETEGVVQVQGIGDAAVKIHSQSISFVSNDLKITLTAVNEEIDLEGVAKAYANWISTRS